MSSYGASRLTRKISLSIFFLVELLAFTICLLALISPTWQYVYLEAGTAEHHHGLWLDCIRLYQFVYGDKESNLKSNFWRNLETSPFAVFDLPELSCVYKFDYYIDQEDLYDHDHDENRVENDAWQHLFLGHKIATLCAIGLAFIFSAAALLIGVCSYCHRTFICATTVLITMAAFFSGLGVAVFVVFANYQDNKVLRQEDEMETYEQQFGWAFYSQVIGTILHFVASILGCVTTSLAFKKGQAKLVKIEVVDADDEPLDPLASSTHLTTSSQAFKRSFSAVYKVDSEALRRWEKEYMKTFKNGGGFQRTASVPNFTKKQRKAMAKAQREASRSQDLFSQVSERTATTGASGTLESQHQRRSSIVLPTPATPKSIMKKSTQSLAQQHPPDPSSTYEYLPGPAPSSIALSTFRPGRSTPSSISNPSVRYDAVYEPMPGNGNYEEPNSTKNRFSNSTIGDERFKRALLPTLPSVSGSAQSIPVQKTTLIDDIAKRPSASQEILSIRERISKEERTIEELRRREQLRKAADARTQTTFSNQDNEKKPLTAKDFGISLTEERGYATIEPTMTTLGITKPSETMLPVSLPALPSATTKPSTSIWSARDDDSTRPPSAIQINTFGNGELRRSVTNLAMKPHNKSASGLFSRRDSSASNSSTATPVKKSSVHRRLLSIVPDEVDRSVGSSTILDNDYIASSASSYVQDAEVRLNLFLNDSMSSSTKDSETTV